METILIFAKNKLNLDLGAQKKTGPVPRAFEVGSKRAPVIDMLSLSEITKEREIVDFD